MSHSFPTRRSSVLFDGNFIERVHGHFDISEIDACLIRFHTDFDIVIDHPFDGDEDFHEYELPGGRFWALTRAGNADLELYRSEEHTSELQSLMRISYAVFCLKKKNYKKKT